MDAKILALAVCPRIFTIERLSLRAFPFWLGKEKAPIHGLRSYSVLLSHSPPALTPVHLPVNELHSTGKKEDRDLHFSLTLKTEGVKRESFFDIF